MTDILLDIPIIGLDIDSPNILLIGACTDILWLNYWTRCLFLDSTVPAH